MIYLFYRKIQKKINNKLCNMKNFCKNKKILTNKKKMKYNKKLNKQQN